jgi:phage recombination protein Bet
MSTAVKQETTLTDEQIELIKTAIARGATDAELQMFVQTCKRMRLDPFARQIFLVKRWDSALKRDVATTQVSIDGFRLIAERTHQYRGQTEPQWCGRDGKWSTVWLDTETPPAAARVGVHREGFHEPLYRVALWGAYACYTKDGDLTAMWRQHGVNQLLKCAEALALRAAFPNELSGVYTGDELPADAEPAPAGPMTANEPQRAAPKLPAGVPAKLSDFLSAKVPAEKPAEIVINPRTAELNEAAAAGIDVDEDTGEVLPLPEADELHEVAEKTAKEAAAPAEPRPVPARVRSMPAQRPEGSCPVWTSGQFQGKSYLDTPRAYLRSLLAGKWAKSATSRQLAWARYAIHERTVAAHAEGRE